jgi:hypothetical protein
VTFDEKEQALRKRLEALPPAARAELRDVLRLPDFERADRIGEFWGHPETRPSENSRSTWRRTRRRGRSFSGCSRR